MVAGVAEEVDVATVSAVLEGVWRGLGSAESGLVVGDGVVAAVALDCIGGTAPDGVGGVVGVWFAAEHPARPGGRWSLGRGVWPLAGWGGLVIGDGWRGRTRWSAPGRWLVCGCGRG